MEPVYLDNHLLVISKPPGMLAQADVTGDIDVLTVWKAYVKRRFNKPGNVYLGLVHRIDRPASGLMVLARTSKSAARLSKLFRDRDVVKEYLAVVEGRPDYSGRLEDHLIKEEGRVRRASSAEPGAQIAELDLTLHESANGFTVVSVRLYTGRPHQIRVQLASRGNPILGDFRYGATKELDGKNLALHAYLLAFEHPVGRIPLTFFAPVPDEWPDAIRDLVARHAFYAEERARTGAGGGS